jgi:hypothetical protein
MRSRSAPSGLSAAADSRHADDLFQAGPTAILGPSSCVDLTAEDSSSQRPGAWGEDQLPRQAEHHEGDDHRIGRHRARIVEAELPRGLSAHGLRKAACRHLAEAGCTAPQIMAISGHKNLKEVQTYIQAVDRLGLAREAVSKQVAADEKRTKVVKPSRRV